MKKLILPVILIIALIGGLLYYMMHKGQEETDDAQIIAHIVPLIPKVPGYVVAVHIDDNQPVKKGDLLIEIAPEDYVVAVDKAQAALNAIEARMTGSNATLATTQTTAPSMVLTAQSAVRAAVANLERTTAELERLKKMNDNFRSVKQLEDAEAEDRMAHSQLAAAKDQLNTANTGTNNIVVAQSGVGEQRALLEEAKAELAAAQLNLSYTKIYASDDGVITNKTVEPGAYLEIGQQLAALVTNERWIVANYKETQLEHMQIGQPVRIEVDAYPDLDLRGKIDSFQRGTGAAFSAFPPENATGNFVKIVQRVPVKIVFDNAPPEGIVLGPGMSVDPVVYTTGLPPAVKDNAAQKVPPAAAVSPPLTDKNPADAAPANTAPKTPDDSAARP